MMVAPRSLQFMETTAFTKRARELGLEENLRELQNDLVANPRMGPIEPGTGGLRKARIGYPGKGKRGGARVHYLYLPEHAVIYLMLAYAKSEQSSLEPDQKVQLRRVVEKIKAEWDARTE